jgi:hypothetical protein
MKKILFVIGAVFITALSFSQSFNTGGTLSTTRSYGADSSWRYFIYKPGGAGPAGIFISNGTDTIKLQVYNDSTVYYTTNYHLINKNVVIADTIKIPRGASVGKFLQCIDAVGATKWEAPFTLTTTGSSGAATFSAGTLNIPQYLDGSTSASNGIDLTSDVFRLGGNLTQSATAIELDYTNQTMEWDDTSGADMNVGIGYFSPGFAGFKVRGADIRLDADSIRLSGIGETDGYVLTSDAAGNATWQAPAGGGGADTSLTWLKAGNAGTTVGTNYIGTSDAVGLNINTNATRAIQVTSAQKVTIGKHNRTTGLNSFTTNPFLDIVDSVNGDMFVIIENRSAGDTVRTGLAIIDPTDSASHIVLQYIGENSHLTNLRDKAALTLGGGHSKGGILYADSANLTLGTSQVVADGTGCDLCVSSRESGSKIGIGIVTPTSYLTIYNSSTPTLALQNSTTGTSATDGFRIEQSGLAAIIRNYEAGAMELATSGSSRFSIGSDGNCAIGLVAAGGTPSRPLTLYEATAPVLQLINSSTGLTSGEGFLLNEDGLDTRLNNREAGGMFFYTSATERASISSAGLIRFNAYGAGTLTTDGSGNITATSDRRVKHDIKPYSKGLKELLKLSPSTFIYNSDSTNTVMPGFIAQDVKRALGNVGIGEGENGMLTLNTNAILAALVNSVKELQEQIDKLAK